ncbi:MAG: hypothetical protein ABJD68_14010 [Nakamurella sp.]
MVDLPVLIGAALTGMAVIGAALTGMAVIGAALTARRKSCGSAMFTTDATSGALAF